MCTTLKNGELKKCTNMTCEIGYPGEKYGRTKRTEPQYVNSKRPEIVICAAVIGVDGRIIRCHRHNHGIAVLAELKVKLRPDHDAQGFITSKNRYVNRKEGLQLQLAAGIPSADIGGYGKELFSEDLY